jgi:DNA-binding transcriptional LysR family regulator
VHSPNIRVPLQAIIARAAPDSLARQALISIQIRELEQYFSTELTVRRGKTLALSEAGENLANLVRSQFQDLEQFQKKLRGQRRNFSIGAGASVLEWLVVPCVSKIRSLLGESALRISSQRSRELAESIRDGQLDFAIVRDDAISEELRLKSSLPLRKRVEFSLCASRKFLRNKPISALSNPTEWRSLPFAANGGVGQLDATFRAAMRRTPFLGHELHGKPKPLQPVLQPRGHFAVLPAVADECEVFVGRGLGGHEVAMVCSRRPPIVGGGQYEAHDVINRRGCLSACPSFLPLVSSRSACSTRRYVSSYFLWQSYFGCLGRVALLECPLKSQDVAKDPEELLKAVEKSDTECVRLLVSSAKPDILRAVTPQSPT